MTSNQESKLNMYRVVLLHIQNNLNVVGAVPAFLTAYNKLSAKVDAISQTVQLEEQIITGIAADKTQLKETLCEQAVDIATMLLAFANAHSNQTLKQAVKVKYSSLVKTKDDLLVPQVQNILQAAQNHLAELADYGITPATLDELQTKINNYHQAVPKPRDAKNKKTNHKANLISLFKDTDTLLKEQLDNLIIAFRLSQPDFYNTYKSSRVIYDPATHPTQIKITVTDALTKQPIPKATITFTDNITATTDTNGAAHIKPIPAGTYDITITASSYAPTTHEKIKIKLGQTTKLEVLLSKI